MKRAQVNTLIEEGGLQGRAGWFLRRALMALTLASAVAVILIADGVEPRWLLALAYGVEAAALTCYVLEYAARLWAAPDDVRRRSSGAAAARARHLISGQSLLDLIVILCMAGHLLAPLLAPAAASTLAVLSLLRLFKVARYSVVLSGIIETVVSSGPALVACIAMVIALGVAGGGFMHLVERGPEAEIFTKLSGSLWWGVMKLADNDASEFTPESTAGNIMAALLGLFGYMVVALPMGVIGAAFQSRISQRQFIITWSMVSRVPFFRSLAPHQIAGVVERLSSQTFQGGQVVVRAGDPGDRMYFVLKGELEVERADGAVILGQGDYFGERALLKREPRSATVRARTISSLLSLSAADLAAILDVNPALRASLGEEMARREASGAPPPPG